MKHKMTGMVAFLVLCCILAETRAYCPTEKGSIGPLMWAPPVVHQLREDKTYLSLGPGSDQPIDVTSRKVDFKNIRNGRKVIFGGNVKMNQGDVTLACDRLIIVYDEKAGGEAVKGKAKKLDKGLGNLSQMKSITASGNVKIIQNERMAVADEALFDNMKRTIILRGGPPKLR